MQQLKHSKFNNLILKMQSSFWAVKVHYICQNHHWVGGYFNF